eukprot:714755-Amorphochlora_amoeboformis.AAC.1
MKAVCKWLRTLTATKTTEQPMGLRNMSSTWVWVLDSDSSRGVEECLGLGFDPGRERMTFAS